MIKKTKCKIVDLKDHSLRNARIRMKEELFKRDYAEGELTKKELKDKYSGIRNADSLKKEATNSKNTKPLYFILPYVEPIIPSINTGFENILTKCPYCSSKLIASNGLTVCSGDNLNNIRETLRNAIAAYGITKAGHMLENPHKRFLDEYFSQGYIDCNYCQEKEYERFGRGK